MKPHYRLHFVNEHLWWVEMPRGWLALTFFPPARTAREAIAEVTR